MNGVIDVGLVTSFPILPNPEVGSVYIGVDATDGHLKIQNSSGVVVDYQSGAVYEDADAVAAINAAILAATSKDNPAMQDVIYLYDSVAAAFRKSTKSSFLKGNVERFFKIETDFVGTLLGDLTSYTSGTGASNQNGTYGQDATNNAIGVTQSDTGTTATGRSGLGTVTGAVFSPTLSKVIYEGRHALEALSSITETFTFYCGLGDFFTGTTEGNNGLFFSYTDLINGGRFLIKSRVAGVDVRTVDTGISPDLDYHIFRVELDESGVEARFYIDAVLVGTINDPDLPGIAHKMGAGFMIKKTLGTTQRNMDSDYVYIESSRSSSR
jgi:hypothetical protein